MTPPDTTEVFETSTSSYWFVGDLLYVVTKKAPRPTPATRQKELETFRQKLGGRQICAIMDLSHAAPSSPGERQRNIVELPKIFKAIAFVIRNPVARMMTHVYLGAMPMSFPVRMFATEKEATEWIREFL